MTDGYATVSSNATFGYVDMSCSRRVDLPGSIIGASQIRVRHGASCGSAGTVTDNVAVAGILNLAASSGTMTVNGNVALTSTSVSVSVFELTPAVKNKLVKWRDDDRERRDVATGGNRCDSVGDE